MDNINMNHRSLLKPLLIPSNIFAVNVCFFFYYDLISFWLKLLFTELNPCILLFS